MKKLINFTILNFIFLLILNATQIVEKVKVEGKVYSSTDKFAGLIIISREELKKMNIKDISSLFKYLPGLTVLRRGPSDVSYDLVMKGGNFEGVTISLNGIPLNNPQTGHFNTDLPITFEDIERIEISNGPGIGLTPSGSTGAINIILKSDKDFKYNLSIGENKFFSTNLFKGFELGNFEFSVSAGKKNSSGYYEGREFESLNFLFNGSYENNGYNVNFTYGKIRKDFGAAGFYAPFPSKEDLNSDVFLVNGKKKTGNFSLGIQYMNSVHNDHFILDRYDPEFYENKSVSKTNYLRIYSVYNRNKINFSFGADIRIENMDSIAMGMRDRTRGGMFFNFFRSLSNFDFSGGIRIDFSKKVKNEILFDLNLKKKISDNISVSFSSAKNMRYPSFTEMYYNSPSNVGNSGLINEKSFNNALEVLFFRENFVMNIKFFYRYQDSFIDWIKYSGKQIWEATNIFDLNFGGYELGLAWDFRTGGVRASIERSYMKKSDIDYVSKYGFRFPDLLVKTGGYVDIGKIFRINSNYEFKRIFQTKERGHFLDTVISLMLRKVKFSIHIDNMFNTVIEEIPGVKVSGRWIYLSISN